MLLRSACFGAIVIALLGSSACASSQATSDGGSGGSGGAGATSDTSSSSTGCMAEIMSDPDNCGSCSHSCLGGPCAAGVCQPVSIPFKDASYQRLGAVTADANGIYFTADGMYLGDVEVFGIGRSGGTPKALFNLDWDSGILFAKSGKVYAYTSSCCIGSNTIVYDESSGKADTSGDVSGSDTISDAWLGNKHAFFGADATLYFNTPANDGARAYITSVTSGFFPKVTGNSHTVFISALFDNGKNTVFKLEEASLVDGKDAKADVLSSWTSDSSASRLAANEDAVFMLYGGNIDRIDIATGMRTTLASDSSAQLLRADADRVYWTTSAANGSGVLKAMPAKGGAIVDLAMSDAMIGGLWVDDLGVVWTTTMPDAVWQLAK